MSSDSARCGRRRLALGRGALAVTLAATLGCAVAGCAPTVLSLAAEAEPANTSYSKAYDRWTRVGRIGSVADLDTPVLIWATLRSRAFQRAYAERYLQTYNINTVSERDKILERERAASEPGLSFWVRTTFHDYLWNDLKAPAGKWRVMLIDEAGVETVAESIDAVLLKDLTQPVLLSERLDPYSKLWLVRFPALRGDGQPLLPAGARKIRLRAAGPVGQTDLIWLLN
jgi:hypothetical protein